MASSTIHLPCARLLATCAGGREQAPDVSKLEAQLPQQRFL